MGTWGPIIKEFKMYNMKNFVVMDKKPKVRATQLRWTLTFCNRTEVEEVDLPSYPLEPFRFRTIPEVLNPEAVTESELFGGSQSHFDISKVCFDASYTEVVGFRNSMVDTETTDSVRITQMPSQSSSPGIEHLRHGQVEIKTIEDAWNSTQEGKYGLLERLSLLTLGRMIGATRDVTCVRRGLTLRKGVYMSAKSSLVVLFNVVLSKSIRYKAEVIAFDGTTTITLLLWDNEIAGLLGVKVQKVHDNLVALDDGYPSILDELLEKKLLFRVNVKSENISGKDMVFTVWDICSDEDVVERYYPKEDEADNKTETGITEAGSSNELLMSSAVVNLQNDSDSQLTMNPLERSVTSMKPKSVARVMEDGDAIQTRGKKIAEEEGQLSTNKFSRKVSKRTKIQIIDGDD
ncbi:hypothetical protein PIB30_047314 [Stylosanthes scabra]|uniref:Uncharacterized protein n=1 Tax=Stylosanthes scabra TaxID=79078 RepID=A0ABU6ZFH4_9FABA|nr:hypothetical protein [Stylosanthes scabra]